MASLLIESAIRAFLIAASTAALLWALRIKTAATRHTAWTAVVIAMLLLPVWSMAGLKLPVRVLRAPVSPQVETFVPPVRSSRVEHVAAIAPPAAPEIEPARPFDWPLVLIGAYLVGALILLTRLVVGTVQANRLRRSAVAERGRATSHLCTTPITIGFLRPMLILPASWPRWPSAQLAAVLTHEDEHVRRHDPLVQWLALINRAVFWFHPLSWWLERRLATLAEEACDAAVLAAGHSPEEYSGYLLQMARQIAHEGRRVQIVGMAMPGSGLKPRLRRILEGLPIPPTSRARAAWTAGLCVISSALFAAGSLTSATAPLANVQSVDPAAPHLAFESASVKPNKSGDTRSPSLISPGGRFSATNNTARALILNAYDISATPNLLQGGPSWIDFERFDVEAKAAVDAIPAGTAPKVLWNRTRNMLRTLLADRFKLRVRRVTKTMPVYQLTVAAKAVPLKKTTLDCGNPASICHGFSGNPLRLEGTAVDMSDLARMLSGYLDKPVVDGTGNSDLFDLKLQWNPFAGSTQPAGAPTAPAGGSREGARPDASSLPDLFTAIQEQAGVKLEARNASVDVYVIDGIERPTSDLAVQNPAPSATFDVASIKPCTDVPRALVGQRGGLKTINNTANRLYLDCISLESLADLAYNRNGDFVINEHIEREVRGGPDWVKSDRFTIEATTTGAPGVDVMMGAMLRALLEDRFQLRVHRETDEVPMYALTVAKDGLKIKPMAPGDCAADDPNAPPVAPKDLFAPGKKPPCGAMTGRSRGSVKVWDFGGISMSDLATTLDADRQILDKTGVAGDFIIHLEYERDDKVLDGVNIFAALEQQLGLKLISIKGTHSFTVIDRVERPRPDAPVESAISTPWEIARARR